MKEIEFIFGYGPGWLGSAAARIADKHGATLVNHTGQGALKHWFAASNRGERKNAELERRVLAELFSLLAENRLKGTAHDL